MGLSRLTNMSAQYQASTFDKNNEPQSGARHSNRRNVRRVDYKENALASNNYNNSANPGALGPLYDKSAPSEFAIPTNMIDRQELQSPDIFRNDGTASHYGEDKILKRQKLVDNYDLSNSIQRIIDVDQKSMLEVQSLQNSAHNQVQNSKFSKADKHSGSMAASVFNPNNLKDKSRKKMMEHYQKEEDEGCYYPNAIRCSFDDPRLIFEEMCYLCGSFGAQTDFVTCTLCAESFHSYCLQLPSNDIQEMYQSNWKCLNCKSCEVCGKATEEEFLIFCETCDRPYHSFCLDPEIKHIPEQWKCEHCFRCRSCGTDKYYNQEDILAGLNLKNKDYSHSKKFSLCHCCGQNEHKKLQCSICYEKTTSDMNRKLETLQCQVCSNYSHAACSRVDLPTLKALLDEVNSKISNEEEKLKSVESVYRCFSCLISSRSVNFLILESCLHYQNIHHMI